MFPVLQVKMALLLITETTSPVIFSDIWVKTTFAEMFWKKAFLNFGGTLQFFIDSRILNMESA
jgi:hypothetical protein